MNEALRVNRLRADFDIDVRGIIVKEKEVEGYPLRSTYLERMLEESEGVEVAKALLTREARPNTFDWLFSIRRHDLTVEYYVALPKYRELFKDNPDYLAVADFRMKHGDAK